MKSVTITFVGHNSDAVAEKFYSWVVDGGLEDQIIDGLDEQMGDGTSVEGIMDANNDTLDIAMRSTATS